MAVLKIADKVCQQTAGPRLMDIVLVFDCVMSIHHHYQIMLCCEIVISLWANLSLVKK